MKIDMAGYSYRGGREENQDAMLLLPNSPLMLCAVADGLGGHQAGALASQMVISTLKTQTEALTQISPNKAEEIIVLANEAVHQHQPMGGSMKSTLAVLWFDGQNSILAHVGDTRIYGFENETLFYQSTDHSVSQLAVLSGEITLEEIRFHVDRNRVLSALGDERKPNIELKQVAYAQKTQTFLLCSDGFWEYVLEDEMCVDLAKATSAQSFLDLMIVRLAKRVEKDHDNFTAVCMQIKEE